MLISSQVLASMPTWKGLEVRNFAQSASNPDVVYLSANAGVFKSSDRGVTWAPLKLPELVFDGLVEVNPGNHKNLAVFPSYQKLNFFESFDEGLTWRSGVAEKPVNATDNSVSVNTGTDTLSSGTHAQSEWRPSAFIASARRISEAELSCKARGNCPNRDAAPAGLPNIPVPGRTSCGVFMSPASRLTQLANCVWDNGSLPSRPSLYRSLDEGKSWRFLGETGEITGLPARWSQTAIHLDVANPDIMLMGWMAGGLYRTVDGGTTWSNVGADLAFRFRDDWIVRLARNETPLYRAVLFRDEIALRAALAAGANINDAGNYHSSVIEADLAASEFMSREEGVITSMYAKLRELGAKTHHGKQLACRAKNLGLSDVLEGLILDGYSLGAPRYSSGKQTAPAPKNLIGMDVDPSDLPHPLDSLPDTAFIECLARSHQDGPIKIIGLPVGYWVNVYLRAARFVAADELAADLFEINEPQLALQVIRAASQRQPFDRQAHATPYLRHRLVAKLLKRGDFVQANQVLATVPDKTGNEIFRHVSRCRPKVTRWIQRFQPAYGTHLRICAELGYDDISIRQRQELLDWLHKVHIFKTQEIPDLMAHGDKEWVKATATYRQFQTESAPSSDKAAGIGVLLTWPGSGIVIKKVTPGFPAEHVGIVPGDVLKEIDGVTTDGFSNTQIPQRLRGKAGSKVIVTIDRSGTTHTFQLKRKLIPKE